MLRMLNMRRYQMVNARIIYSSFNMGMSIVET